MTASITPEPAEQVSRCPPCGVSLSQAATPGHRVRARCAVVFEPLGDEDPGIWTVGVGKRSLRPATVRITVTFSRT